MKRKMIYVGPLYRWDLQSAERRHFAGRYFLFSVIGLLLYFAGIWNYSRLSHVWYVLIPYISILLCIVYMNTALYNIYKEVPIFSREVKDKTKDRLKGACAMGMLLSAASGGGQICNFIISGWHPAVSDLPIIVASLALFLIFLICFRDSRCLTFHQVENPAAAEWENK